MMADITPAALSKPRTADDIAAEIARLIKTGTSPDLLAEIVRKTLDKLDGLDFIRAQEQLDVLRSWMMTQ